MIIQGFFFLSLSLTPSSNYFKWACDFHSASCSIISSSTANDSMHFRCSLANGACYCCLNSHNLEKHSMSSHCHSMQLVNSHSCCCDYSSSPVFPSSSRCVESNEKSFIFLNEAMCDWCGVCVDYILQKTRNLAFALASRARRQRRNDEWWWKKKTTWRNYFLCHAELKIISREWDVRGSRSMLCGVSWQGLVIEKVSLRVQKISLIKNGFDIRKKSINLRLSNVSD